MRIVVGVTGGSGAVYAVELLKTLRGLKHETHLVVSDVGAQVARHECGLDLGQLQGMCDVFYDNSQLGSAIASGSFTTDAMVVVPCSMKTLAGIAHGYSDNLLARAADVFIKEQRKLILVVREMPLSAIHLKNMLILAKLGVIILPPCPAFYHHPQTLDDMIRFMVGKILDQLKIDNKLYERWKGEMKCIPKDKCSETL